MGSRTLALLCILPLLTYARIHIDVNVSQMDPENLVKVTGQAQEPLTEQDLMDFQLNEDNLKDAIQMYFGERPDEVYTNSPTPYGDLYEIFRWNQVMKMMQPIKARVLSVTGTPMAVDKQIYTNTDEMDKIFTIPISYQVQNIITSKWAMATNMTSNENMIYKFDIEKSSMTESNMVKYVHEFGKNMMLMEPVTIGINSGVEISLSPKQKVIAELYVNKQMMAIQLDYETKLIGSVAVGYNNGFRGHRFWSVDVSKIMNMMKEMKMNEMASEMLEVTYFAEPRVVIRDFYTSEVMYSIPMMM